jgi:hypothetical protein
MYYLCRAKAKGAPGPPLKVQIEGSDVESPKRMGHPGGRKTVITDGIGGAWLAL